MRVYGATKWYRTLSVKGEELLTKRLTKWLHDEAKIPRSNPQADPLYIFCARVGCGRIRRSNPGSFDSYAVYELKPNDDGRFDDVVLTSGQIARVCGVNAEEVNRIYQQCLAYLRDEKVAAEVKKIFKEHGEKRK